MQRSSTYEEHAVALSSHREDKQSAVCHQAVEEPQVTKGGKRGQKRDADKMREAEEWQKANEELDRDLERERQRDIADGNCDDDDQETEDEEILDGKQPPAPPVLSKNARKNMARTEEGRKKRRLKQKKKRVRRYGIILPESAESKKHLDEESKRMVFPGITRSLPKDTATDTFMWHDQHNTVPLGLLRNRLSAEMLQTLVETATDWISNENPIVYQAPNTPQHQERAGHKTNTAHCGFFLTPDVNTSGAQAFIKANAELFNRVNDELKKHWPHMMVSFVLNWDIEWHADKADVAGSLCVVIPFGEFTGGELVFPELGQAVHLVAGDIMAFSSALLVQGTPGSCHSLILNCCAYNFHGPYPEA